MLDLERDGAPAPIINPSPDGAIYAEWHMKDLDIEMIFEAPDRIVVLAEDARNEIPPIEAEGLNMSIAAGALYLLRTR
ncbi:MAG: hypothetical protein EXR07_20505 [Acetobacteraceae bacterium]|nr:hypothetical protein [Acetobacteraceae bacterium]